jgi:uncharacterized protein (TIGR02246 family)
VPTPEQTRIFLLYKDLLQAWNERSARDFAVLFMSDGNSVGFDGSQLDGRRQIESELKRIFADHETAAYVAKIREIRELRPFVTLLRAIVGMVPPGQTELNPAANAVQSLVAVEREGELRIALLHNTPAAFHGRPEAAEQLTAELTEVLRRGDLVAEG